MKKEKILKKDATGKLEEDSKEKRWEPCKSERLFLKKNMQK